MVIKVRKKFNRKYLRSYNHDIDTKKSGKLAILIDSS